MHSLIGQTSFSFRVQRHGWRHFCFVLEHRDMVDIRKTQENLGYSLGIFLVEMTFMFLSQHRDTQAIFYLLNRNLFISYKLLLYKLCNFESMGLWILTLYLGLPGTLPWKSTKHVEYILNFEFVIRYLNYLVKYKTE